MVSLKEKYKDYFHIGAAVNGRTVETCAELLKAQFNSITCENETKFVSLQTEEDNFNFKKADKIVNFAKENGMHMRGHTFTWHNQTPRWVFEDADKETLLARLRKHMEVVGKRYENDIFCWDVVNEAIEDKSDIFMRQSPWTDILGENFMDYSFRMAREILPNTQLFYNDYNETDVPKRDKIHAAVKGMLDRGVPVDGIGMQCHWSIYSPSMDEVRKSIELYASLGVKLHITEMDISMYRFNDQTKLDKPSQELLEKQGKVYGEAFKLFREYKDVVDSVTLWGVADDYTWLDHFPVRNRKNWPMLFDENHQPKDAFYRITDF